MRVEVYVYGTGCGAGELIDTVLPAERVAAFVDGSPQSDRFLGGRSSPPRNWPHGTTI